MIHPLIFRRYQLLEGFLDSFAENIQVKLENSKVVLASAQLPQASEINYSFTLPTRHQFKATLDWTNNASVIAPFLNIEVAMCSVHSDQIHMVEEVMLRQLRYLPGLFRIIRKEGWLVLQLNARVDKIASEYLESSVRLIPEILFDSERIVRATQRQESAAMTYPSAENVLRFAKK